MSAYQHADKLWASLINEVSLGHMLGPFPVQPLDPLICSLVGMVEKQDSQEMRHITHLSHLRGRSINAYIDQGPVQVIQFLGLTIDTVLMVIKVPEDKRTDILKILTKMVQKRKATSLDLQSLAGK